MIGRSCDRLIATMAFPSLVRRHIYTESMAWIRHHHNMGYQSIGTPRDVTGYWDDIKSSVSPGHPFRPPFFTSGTPSGWVFKCQTYSCWVLLFHFESLPLGKFLWNLHIWPLSFGPFLVKSSYWYSVWGKNAPRGYSGWVKFHPIDPSPPLVLGAKCPPTPTPKYKDGLSRCRISIIKIRLSWDRLILIMGIPYRETVVIL